MSVVCARAVWLTASQRDRLKKVARGHKSGYRDRLRAQIVLDAAADHPNAAPSFSAPTRERALHA